MLWETSSDNLSEMGWCKYNFICLVLLALSFYCLISLWLCFDAVSGLYFAEFTPIMDLKKLKIGFNNFIRQISCNEKVEVFFFGGGMWEVEYWLLVQILIHVKSVMSSLCSWLLFNCMSLWLKDWIAKESQIVRQF